VVEEKGKGCGCGEKRPSGLDSATGLEAVRKLGWGRARGKGWAQGFKYI
jgi:hypothetical protein